MFKPSRSRVAVAAACCAALMGMAGTMPAQGQTPPARGPRPTLAAINCDALNQGTLICVRNALPVSISKITCSGFWGSNDLSIPNGTIRSGETTIVDFYKGRCNTHIVVTGRDGHQYAFDGFDTIHNTTLLVDGD